MRAAEHAPRGPFHVLERRHGLAEIGERGAFVLVYNVLKRREKKLGKSFRIQDVFVLHLVGGKPWEPGDPGAGEYPLSHGAWHAIRRECGLPDDGY